MIVWRVAYLDEDLGACYAWAPTQIDGRRVAAEIHAHYSKLGGYVPEVFKPARVFLPTRGAGRPAMCAWLNTHLCRAPAPAKATDPAFGSMQWRTQGARTTAHLAKSKRQRSTAEPRKPQADPIFARDPDFDLS